MSKKDQTAAWTPTGSPLANNSVLEGEDFYISYAARPGAFLSMFASDDGEPETALVINGKFYILNGDFRTDYARLVPEGKAACLAFFREKAPTLASSWSDKLVEE